MKVVIGHLYPDYLNIYADRGNIAVFEQRAAWRGIELEVEEIGPGDEVRPGAHDLLYIGGGQDREQALIAPDLAAKGESVKAAVEAGAALLAVCGGYQLLGQVLPRPLRSRAARRRASFRCTRWPASGG